MTTSIEQVRAIISDHPNYHRATATGDGATTLFTLPYHPVIDASAAVTLDGTAKTEGTHYTLDDNLGLLTFLAAPADGAAIAVGYHHTLLSDDDLETFLALQTGDVRLAAAMALDTIATNEALVQKRIKLLDITTDGPAVAKSLREHAAQLREEADGDDAFDWAEMVTTTSAWDERIFAQAQRGIL